MYLWHEVLQKGAWGRQGALSAHFMDTLPLCLPSSPASLPLTPPLWLSAASIQTPVSWLNQTSFFSCSLVSLPPHRTFMCLWALHCCHSPVALFFIFVDTTDSTTCPPSRVASCANDSLSRNGRCAPRIWFIQFG